jgi:hypothetical protein
MNDWPEVSIARTRDTLATIALYSQIVGKIRLALTPKTNQWWNVTLYLTTRGLTTSPMPYSHRTLAIDFDFIEHRLIVRDSDGRERAIDLVPARSVAELHRALFAELATLGVEVHIHPLPQECPLTVPFTEDLAHCTYDASVARDLWTVFRRAETVFQVFRARFRGKCSPVHLFWGGFDLAVTRFNGRRAPPRKNKVDRDAYDEEVISLGFWPGDAWTAKSEPMFYSYTAPEPVGFSQAIVRPDAAYYDQEGFHEFALPYDAVRRASDPARTILEFAQSTYDVGSTLAGWDREALAYP